MVYKITLDSQNPYVEGFRPNYKKNAQIDIILNIIPPKLTWMKDNSIFHLKQQSLRPNNFAQAVQNW